MIHFLPLDPSYLRMPSAYYCTHELFHVMKLKPSQLNYFPKKTTSLQLSSQKMCFVVHFRSKPEHHMKILSHSLCMWCCCLYMMTESVTSSLCICELFPWVDHHINRVWDKFSFYMGMVISSWSDLWYIIYTKYLCFGIGLNFTVPLIPTPMNVTLFENN